ncbi:MAG: RNA-binding transcriptional accessory protein, partial [Hyphomicrobiales bacterium]|nr:RNA-binding transcriptional accessory protein [Hyphomicrobiales bacterium]
MKSINQRIAEELNVAVAQIGAAVDLLDGGATVPFIARYRKEATGALDDTQLRTLEERLRYLRELEERRAAILESVKSQGKLDAALEGQINAADSKARLEDIYLPYKPKRRTKAQIARENGLEPLAEALLAHPEREPKEQGSAYLKPEAIETPEAALEGARAILVERFAEDAELIGRLREDFWKRGVLTTKVREGKEQAGAKFSDYFDFSEPLTKLPSHRILAVMRGEREEVLDLRMVADPTADPVSRVPGPYELAIAARVGVSDRGRPGDKWLVDCVRWAWR